jgi:hypothetical protein
VTDKAGNAQKADQAAFRWQRKRHPNWSDDRISRLIARSRVIDEHPSWDDAEIDREVMCQRAIEGKIGRAHV